MEQRKQLDPGLSQETVLNGRSDQTQARLAYIELSCLGDRGYIRGLTNMTNGKYIHEIQQETNLIRIMYTGPPPQPRSGNPSQNILLYRVIVLIVHLE